MQFSGGLVGNNAYVMGGVNFVIIVAKYMGDLVTSGGMDGTKLWGATFRSLTRVSLHKALFAGDSLQEPKFSTRLVQLLELCQRKP